MGEYLSTTSTLECPTGSSRVLRTSVTAIGTDPRRVHARPSARVRAGVRARVPAAGTRSSSATRCVQRWASGFGPGFVERVVELGGGDVAVGWTCAAIVRGVWPLALVHVRVTPRPGGAIGMILCPGIFKFPSRGVTSERRVALATLPSH